MNKHYFPPTPLSFQSVIMSSGDKSKSSSQTDGKAAQSKKSEMGMMSYKVGGALLLQLQKIVATLANFRSHSQTIVALTCFFPPDVRVRPGELPGSHDRDQQRVHECV